MEMGRAERRKAERRERIEDRKHKVLLTHSQLTELKNTAEETVARFDVECLTTCFALVLHDQYGWGQKRIMRCLQQIDDTFRQVLRDELDLDEMKRRLKDECQIVITGW